MLSVVVCTHNPRADLLARCLDAIICQLKGRPDRELIVVDNASSGALSVEIVDGCQMRVVRENELGLTAARRRAAAEARGDVIVFVDDDNILHSDYLDEVVKLFDDAALGVVSGNIVPECEAPAPGWLPRFEPQLAIRRVEGSVFVAADPQRYDLRFPVGAGVAVRAQILRDYFADASSDRIEGRYGDQLLGGEDTDIALFAASVGTRIGVCGSLKLTHVIPAARLTEGYLIRLHKGAIVSAFAVQRKWAQRGSQPIFSFASESILVLLAKAVAYTILSVRAEFRILASIQRAIVRERVR